MHGILTNHPAIKNIQDKGCCGCPTTVHHATLKNGNYYWLNAPFSTDKHKHKPEACAHRAVTSAHDDGSYTLDPAMIVINCAVNDDHLNPALHHEIADAAKAHDCTCNEAFTACCDNSTKCPHTFLVSRVSCLQIVWLGDNPEMRRRECNIAGPHA